MQNNPPGGHPSVRGRKYLQVNQVAGRDTGQKDAGFSTSQRLQGNGRRPAIANEPINCSKNAVKQGLKSEIPINAFGLLVFNDPLNRTPHARNLFRRPPTRLDDLTHPLK